MELFLTFDILTALQRARAKGEKGQEGELQDMAALPPPSLEYVNKLLCQRQSAADLVMRSSTV